MSAIVDMLYREYCRARLTEMRKQLLIRGVGDKTLQVPWENDDPADRGAQRSCWVTKESPSSIG
ncbi:hypothetical protein AC630_13230 [Bradyrhizobium sp. AS23.2]|nr:hypothetical protein AC630_13230 [Bradyrhizobium sp. AS23.2]